MALFPIFALYSKYLIVYEKHVYRNLHPARFQLFIP